MPPQLKSTADRGVAASRTSLSRILGLGFGIAVIFGVTVGVGILRLTLYRNTGAIVNPRISLKGDLVAFLEQPLGVGSIWFSRYG
jgi:hypothetical protein